MVAATRLKESFQRKNRLALSLAIVSGFLILGGSLASATDNVALPDKANHVSPLNKPVISKPTDALVSKEKESGKLDQTKSAKVVPSESTQTPSGRVINDLRVVPSGAYSPGVTTESAPSKSQVAAPSSRPPGGDSPKAVAAPTPAVPASTSAASATLSAAVSSGSTSSQSPAADPLEEKVRSLLQERLGKDGEVIIRVSPDSPIEKSDGATRSASTRARIGSVTSEVSKTDGGKAQESASNPSRSQGAANESLEMRPWDWRGLRGPAAWGRLDPSYGACSSGKMQSPPSILESQVIPITGPILPQLYWKQHAFAWAQLGPLWVANLESGSSTVFRGQPYALEAIQFRVPGEPFIGDKPPAASIHFVHRLESRYFVISVPIRIDDQAVRNPGITSLLQRFPFDRTDKLTWSGLALDPQTLLPKQIRSGIFFSGSLSYPPCTESVLWFLAQPSVSLPTSQWAELSRLLGEGGRPPQPLNGRPVLSVFGGTP